TSSAGINLSDHGGCSTTLRLAFGGLVGTQVNGTWVLTVANRSALDIGNVTSALLSIESEPKEFSSGFEDGEGAVAAPPPIGGCSTALRMAFGGRVEPQVNGTWWLTVTERPALDVGNVTSALLSIESEPKVFSTGCEDGEGAVAAPPRIGSCRRAPLYLTGTG